LKVRERADQLIVGLVLRSHGRPRTIRADGCSFFTRRERDWVKKSAKRDRDIQNSWINPVVAGLPSKRHSAIGRSRRSNTKGGEAARDESKKSRVAPESIKADTGWKTRELKRDEKEDL